MAWVYSRAMLEPLYLSHDQLGEGPVWHANEQALYWVDIEGRKVQRYVPETKEHQQWHLRERVCGVAPRRGGGLVVALEHDLTIFDSATADITPFASLDTDKPKNRNNDMKCDPQGRLWVGTMQSDAQGRAGSLYRVNAHGSVSKMLGNIGIANTLAWSPDESQFYFADSSQNVIWVFDYDAPSGDISKQRIFFEGGPGAPDGSAMDSQGYLWNARYGGSCVLRIAPDGTLEQTLEIPAENPTSCAFGGADLKTLFVTSAGGENAAAYEGCVFSAQVEVAGKKVGEFAD